LLQQVRETTLGAYSHQELPFDKLVEELKPQRDLRRNPLVQVLLVMQNAPRHALQMNGSEVSSFELVSETSRFDLALFLSEDGQALAGGWLYNADLFEAATIRKLSRHYEALLESLVADPDARIESLKMLDDNEVKQTMAEQAERQESQISRLR